MYKEADDKQENFNRARDVLIKFLQERDENKCNFVFISEHGDNNQRFCMTSGTSSNQNIIGLIEIFKSIIISEELKKSLQKLQ